MKLTEAIQSLEKNKASELFFSDIIDYVNSIKQGENEVFDLKTLDLIEDSINESIKFLEEKKKNCYDTVQKISNFEIKNGNTTRKKSSTKRAPAKSKRGSKKV